MVPIAARDGDNVAFAATTMPWYDGVMTVAAIVTLRPLCREDGAQFRPAVQGVIRRDLQRIVVGRIEAGMLCAGDEIVLSPGARRARVKTLELWPELGTIQTHAGESIGFTLNTPLLVERGDVVSDRASAPSAATRFRVRLLWLGHRPLRVGDRLRMRIGTRLAHVEIETFKRVVDIASLCDADGIRPRRMTLPR